MYNTPSINVGLAQLGVLPLVRTSSKHGMKEIAFLHQNAVTEECVPVDSRTL